MTCIYLAADPIEAEIVRSLLAADGIDSFILGDLVWGARGEIGADPYPRVMLRDERDAGRARDILDEYRQARSAAHKSWTCPCGESVPGNFAACWACGAMAA